MRLFRRNKSIRLNPKAPDNYNAIISHMPEDMMRRCPHCKRLMMKQELTEERLCPSCQYHLPMSAMQRIEWILDEGSFEEWDGGLVGENPLDFPNYEDKLGATRNATGLLEAVITGSGRISDLDIAIGVMDNRFMMGSMGAIVGEKLTRLFEKATQKRLPVILYITSGGARMQEGMISLMQMAKVSQAVSRHSQAGLFYLSILTHPTTGGVTASFAMQGDLIMAEPLATIGFAGRRVIEQTTREKLSDDFQSAEQALANGFIDCIASRIEQPQLIAHLLRIHQTEEAKGHG